MATEPSLDAFLGTPARPWWRRYLKWLLVGLGVLLAALLVWRLLFGGAQPTQYATEAAQRGNLTVTVSATGKLAPTNQVEVGSEVSGLVMQVLVDVNDRVTKGQTLAVVDTARLDDAITQSRASLNANIAQVAQAQATVVESQAQLARLEEVRRLSGGKVPAEVELQTARATVQRSVAALRAAQANVVSARAALSSNETQRARAVIKSPVNGVVLARQVDEGQTVAASFNTPTMFVIAEDLTAMELQVAIDEADVGSVQEGQIASFTVDAFPGKTFPARITRVDLGSNLSASSASSSTTSTSTTSSTVVSYAATLSVANPDLQLRPGMTATAEIVTKSRPNILLVPNAALRFTPAAAGGGAGAASAGQGGIAGALVPRRPGRSSGGAEKGATTTRGADRTVYVLGEDGQPQPVKVTIGDTNGTVTEITGGDLKPGMKVITGQLASGTAAGQGGQRRQGGAGAGGPGGGGQRGGQ